MLILFELFGVAFLCIWCGNGVPVISFFSTTLLHMTTSINCVPTKAK